MPVLDVDVNPLALTGVAPRELSTGNLTPVPTIVDGALAPSVAEQLAQIDEDQPKAARVNAAAEIPATGVKVRTAQEAAVEGVTSEALYDQIRERIGNEQGAQFAWRLARPQAQDGVIPEGEVARVLAEVEQYGAGFPEEVDA